MKIPHAILAYATLAASCLAFTACTGASSTASAPATATPPQPAVSTAAASEPEVAEVALPPEPNSSPEARDEIARSHALPPIEVVSIDEPLTGLLARLAKYAGATVTYDHPELYSGLKVSAHFKTNPYNALAGLGSAFDFAVAFTNRGWRIERRMETHVYPVSKMPATRVAWATAELLKVVQATTTGTPDQPSVLFDAKRHAFIVTARPSAQDAAESFVKFSDTKPPEITYDLTLIEGSGASNLQFPPLQSAEAAQKTIETLKAKSGVGICTLTFKATNATENAVQLGSLKDIPRATVHVYGAALDDCRIVKLLTKCDVQTAAGSTRIDGGPIVIASGRAVYAQPVVGGVLFISATAHE